MPRYITEHFCTLRNIRKVNIPRLSPSASRWQKISRFIKIITTISRDHSDTTLHFRSSIKVDEEIERQLNREHFVIHPLSLFSEYWRFLMCFVWYINIAIGLMVPLLHACIQYEITSQRPLRYLYKSTNYICVVHILISFLTGYRNKKTKQYVLELKDIAIHYITRFFLVDLLVFDFIIDIYYTLFRVSIPQHIVMGIWKLARVLRLITAGKYLENFTRYFKLTTESYRIFQILIKWFYLVHIHAMAYLSISAVKMTDRSWTTRLCKVYRSKNIFINTTCTGMSAETLHYYIQHSYKETLSRICLLSWGQLSPKTSEDRWNTIITLMSGFCFNVYFIVFIKARMESAYHSSSSYEHQVINMKTFSKKHFLPEDLESKLLMSLDENCRGEHFNTKKYVKIMSDTIKADLFTENIKNFEIVLNSNIFDGVSSTGYIAIIKCLKRGVYFPGDVIESAGSPEECMYIIATGAVAVYNPDGEELYHLVEGEHFGVHTIQPQSVNWKYTVIAIEVCEIYRLSKRNYEEKITQHDERFIERMTSEITTKASMMDLEDPWRDTLTLRRKGQN